MGESNACAQCAVATVEELYSKACSESNSVFGGFWTLHKSFKDMRKAAAKGCGFCQLILESFRGRIHHEFDCGGSCLDEDWWGPPCDPSRTMYASVERLALSEVRLRISSPYMEPGNEAAIHDAPIEDLLVHVGPLTKDTTLALAFKLTTPRARPVYIRDVDAIKVGRFQIQGCLASDEHTEVGKKWLHRCQTLHEACRTAELPTLPTRIVKIGTSMDCLDLRIVESGGIKANYVTLSHCWGGPIDPLLTTGTIFEFKERLSFATLPANFQDAIMITKRLGFEYVWIDSLCIIQDSRADWAIESRKMGDVYRNSVVTISAMSSPGSTHGILPKSAILQQGPASAELRVSPSSTATVTVTRASHEEETIQELYASAPLSQRGWVMQELMLSPRHLFYGNEQVYWRCHAGFDAADGPTNGKRAPNDSLQASKLSRSISSRTETSALDNESDRMSLLVDYYILLQLYTQRHLTVSSDILPAFSGITSRLQPYLGGHYLAGLWSADIVKGLLWKRSDIWCKHSTPYRAPSWSWAITDDPVTFPDGTLTPKTSQCLELVSHHIRLRNAANPFGEISAATLTVTGLTMPLVFSKQLLQESGSHPHFYGETTFDEPPPGYSDDAHGSRIQLIFGAEDGGRPHLLVCAWHHTGTEHELGFDKSAYMPEEYLALIAYVDGGLSQQYTEGLILKPSGGLGDGAGGCYERVGTFTFYEPGMVDLDPWRRRKLRLV